MIESPDCFFPGLGEKTHGIQHQLSAVHAGHILMVTGRRDLHHIHSDDTASLRYRFDDGRSLFIKQAEGHRGTGSDGDGRIPPVDIKGNLVILCLWNAAGHPFHSFLPHLPRGDNDVAIGLGILKIRKLRAANPPNADLHDFADMGHF